MVGRVLDREEPALADKTQTERQDTARLAGDKAPAFTLPDQDGNKVSLTDFAGQPVVVYFYPADDTPGCTKEACQFNDNLRAFSRAGAAVVGISPDGAEKHGKFRDQVRAAVPAAQRRRPRRDGALRRLGREDAVREEVGGGDPVDVPGRAPTARSSGPGTT